MRAPRLPGSLAASVLEFARAQAAQRQKTSLVLAQISPSPFPLISAVLSDPAVAAVIKPGSVVVDMGMGDGRWLLSLLDHYREIPRVCAIGIELDEERIQVTRQSMEAQGYSGAGGGLEIVRADFMSVSVGLSNLVLAYLSREGNKVLAAKLERELSPGAVVVAVGFMFVWLDGKGRLTRTHKCPTTGLPAYIYVMD